MNKRDTNSWLLENCILVLRLDCSFIQEIAPRCVRHCAGGSKETVVGHAEVGAASGEEGITIKGLYRIMMDEGQDARMLGRHRVSESQGRSPERKEEGAGKEGRLRRGEPVRSREGLGKVGGAGAGQVKGSQVGGGWKSRPGTVPPSLIGPGPLASLRECGPLRGRLQCLSSSGSSSARAAPSWFTLRVSVSPGLLGHLLRSVSLISCSPLISFF